ncbi:hypothetical protein ACS0TY_004091 [Phlomoides rotata]
MAEILSRRDSSRARSARVQPICDDEHVNVIQVSTITPMSVDGGGGGEYNTLDAWLPITESRNGNILTATLHLFCSGIGTQLLSLPLAFVYLGW